MWHVLCPSCPSCLSLVGSQARHVAGFHALKQLHAQPLGVTSPSQLPSLASVAHMPVLRTLVASHNRITTLPPFASALLQASGGFGTSCALFRALAPYLVEFGLRQASQLFGASAWLPATCKPLPSLATRRRHGWTATALSMSKVCRGCRT